MPIVDDFCFVECQQVIIRAVHQVNTRAANNERALEQKLGPVQICFSL